MNHAKIMWQIKMNHVKIKINHAKIIWISTILCEINLCSRIIQCYLTIGDCAGNMGPQGFFIGICRLNQMRSMVNHVRIKINHVRIEINHAKIKIKHVQMQMNHVKIEINHVRIRIHHVKIKINHVRIMVNHVIFLLGAGKIKWQTWYTMLKTW